MRSDRSWNQANWEGNESMIRIGMVVRPSRNTVLWSKIGFQNTLPGFYTNQTAVSDTFGTGAYSYTRDQYAHDKSTEQANIHEDMSAGIAIRTIPASFQLRMGNINWTEASPLTIWKSQPRNTAWDFLPYEIEQPVSRYYEYNIAKGAKEGRASWHKKAFNGINLESINLPWNLYFNALYATYERYDNCEREYVDWSNDISYLGESNETKGRGIGDSYRHMMHLRLARAKLLGDLTFGLNYVGINYNQDILSSKIFWKAFKINSADPFTITNLVTYKAFYKEPKIASFDAKGMVTPQLELQGDLAASFVDTTHVRFDSSGEHISASRSDIGPAMYAHLKSTYLIPANIDLAYVSRGFYSPFSFATPVDAFFPFGANLLGAGKFIGRAEASPYTQNMAGACLNVTPNIGYGHLKFTYGQHAQVDKARDVLFFPYRLNGQDLFSVFQSSYNRWGADIISNSIKSGAYKNRLGDQSYSTNANLTPIGPEGGGLRSDYLAMFEGFVPYEDSAHAAANYNEKTTIFTRSANVPVHRKFTFNCEVDCAYDISSFLGYNHDFFLSGYAALNGVSTSMTPIAFSEKSQLLWSWFLRFEPAIALTDKFYLLGLAGYENWRSKLGWMYNDTSFIVENVPIDFRDIAYGLGFDWEMGSRMGLHCRAKWMEHEDRYFTYNNWKTPIVSSEIKMWF